MNTRYKKGDYFIVTNRSALAGLDPLAQVLFLWLCARADERGICFPSASRLSQDTGIGRSTIFSKIKILEERGFIRKMSGNSMQSNTYELLLVGSSEDELGGSADGRGVVQEVYSNNTHINNTHEQLGVSSETQVRRKETQKQQITRENAPLISEVIRAFVVIDPKNAEYIKNKTQRASADFLVQNYGFQNVLSVIDLLRDTNRKPYFPSITSPYELKEKWVKLASAIQRLQEEEKSKKLFIGR